MAEKQKRKKSILRKSPIVIIILALVYGGYSYFNLDRYLPTDEWLASDADRSIIGSEAQDTLQDTAGYTAERLHSRQCRFSSPGCVYLIPSEQKTTITDTSSCDNIWLHEEETCTSAYHDFDAIFAFDELLFDNADKAASPAVSDHRSISVFFSTGQDND